MHTTWIESPIQGRHGGPIRAGQWSFVVIGTHPVQVGQTVDLELFVNEQPYGTLPAYWLENKSGNSYWHVPVPPIGINSRIRYMAITRGENQQVLSQTHMLQAIVRPNPPRNMEFSQVVQHVPEGLVGNRQATARVDSRSATQDIYFPSVALHSSVRPSEGDSPQSRTHFRTIVAGFAETGQIDWLGEPVWESRQRYEPGTAVLRTVLSHREGQLRLLVSDMAVMTDPWPDHESESLTPGLFLKRYQVINDADHDRTLIFAIYVHAETNGGIGEPVLSWLDSDEALVASNAGHGHSNRKLARDATVSFVVALDGNGETSCEPVGPMETMLTRNIFVPARGSAQVDLLIAGSFSNHQADTTIFGSILRPALKWFRAGNMEKVEQATIRAWQQLLAGQSRVTAPNSTFAETLERSGIAALLHCDANFGSIASGFDRGLNAYCRPREAIFTAECLGRFGFPGISRKVFEWLESIRDQNPYYRFWFQKYSMDGKPEWETPSIDQTALIPWALDRHVRRTGETALFGTLWPAVQQAADVMMGRTRHPGLQWEPELSLMRSSGMWDLRFGCHLFGNAALVAGLRASAGIAEFLGQDDRSAAEWRSRADEILNRGILGTFRGDGPGLTDPEKGHLRPARRLNRRVGHWIRAEQTEFEEPNHADPGSLGLCVPLGLLPSDDERLYQSFLALVADLNDPKNSANAYRTLRHDIQVLTRLWMARYCLRLAHDKGSIEKLRQAHSLLDEVIEQLGPLGLGILTGAGQSTEKKPMMIPGVWSLHLQVIELFTELGGLHYDALANRLSMRPCVPDSLPAFGMRSSFPFGDFRYQIQQESRQRYCLMMEWESTTTVTLQADVVTPATSHAGKWQTLGDRDGYSHTPQLYWDAARHALKWTETLPAGRHRVTREWQGSIT